MRDVDVLFLVEHVSRELDVATCLATILEDRFHLRCEVKGYYLDFGTVFDTFRPRVVLFPFFYGADHEYPIEYLRRWPDATFVNLGWEQILMKVDLGMKTPRDDAARLRVRHLCWSQTHADFLQSKGVPAAHTTLTGSPVLKLFDEPYRSYFEVRQSLAAKHGLDDQRPWVLFPEAYQYAFFSNDRLASLAANQNADLGLMQEAKAYSENSLCTLLDHLCELDRDSDPIFILRPRPSTTAAAMQDFVTQRVGQAARNLRVIKDGSAREWILAADKVMSSHSTTLIEAAVAGKAIQRFEPGALPQALAATWHELVPAVGNRESVLTWLRAPPDGASGAGLNNWARSVFLPRPDPFEAIADLVSSVISDRERRTSRPARSVLSRCVDWFRGPRKRATSDDPDFFDATEVARRKSGWRQVLG